MFFLKFFLNFIVSFIILSIPIGDKPLFDHAYILVSPIVNDAWDFSKKQFQQYFAKGKEFGNKFFSNSKPTEEDKVNLKDAATLDFGSIADGGDGVVSEDGETTTTITSQSTREPASINQNTDSEESDSLSQEETLLQQKALELNNNSDNEQNDE